jgi:hypothetical protein
MAWRPLWAHPTGRVHAGALMSFAPIDGIGFVQRTISKARPVAVRRVRGVDMDNFRKSELDALLNAGPLGSPSATRVEREIQDRRGGVLPRNWTVVKHYKANVDMIARMNLRGTG